MFVFLARISIIFNYGHIKRWNRRASTVTKWLIIKLRCLSASGVSFFEAVDKTEFR